MTLAELIEEWERRRRHAENVESRVPEARLWEIAIDEVSGLDGVESRHQMMDTSEAAEVLRITRKTAAKWAAKGRFPGATKTSENGNWRIPAADVYGELDGGKPANDSDEPADVERIPSLLDR